MTKGFTVIELILVIVIIGILAVVVIPRGLDINPVQNRESAEMVAGEIRHLQELALAGTGSQSLVFIAGSTSFTAGNRVVSLPSGVTIGTTTTITFNRLGIPTANPSFTVDIGGVTVVVNPNTGRVTVP